MSPSRPQQAAIEENRVPRAARLEVATLGISLYYRPAYSPELNDIEAVVKQVKHHEIPQRSHTSKAELPSSVEEGFYAYRKQLRPGCFRNDVRRRNHHGHRRAGLSKR